MTTKPEQDAPSPADVERAVRSVVDAANASTRASVDRVEDVAAAARALAAALSNLNGGGFINVDPVDAADVETEIGGYRTSTAINAADVETEIGGYRTSTAINAGRDCTRFADAVDMPADAVDDLCSRRALDYVRSLVLIAEATARGLTRVVNANRASLAEWTDAYLAGDES